MSGWGSQAFSYTIMAFGGDGASEAGAATLKLGGETMLPLTCDTAVHCEAASDDFSIAIGLKPALIDDGNMHGFVDHHTCGASGETWAPLLTVETDSASSTPLPQTLSTAAAAFPFSSIGHLDVTGRFKCVVKVGGGAADVVGKSDADSNPATAQSKRPCQR